MYKYLNVKIVPTLSFIRYMYLPLSETNRRGPIDSKCEGSELRSRLLRLLGVQSGVH